MNLSLALPVVLSAVPGGPAAVRSDLQALRRELRRERHPRHRHRDEQGHQTRRGRAEAARARRHQGRQADLPHHREHQGDEGELVWFDPETDKVTRRMKVGPRPNQLACTPDGKIVYIPCDDASWWVIDTVK